MEEEEIKSRVRKKELRYTIFNILGILLIFLGGYLIFKTGVSLVGGFGAFAFILGSFFLTVDEFE